MSELNLIKIKITHREIVWQWRNDINTKRLSFNSKSISWEEHILWFDKVLKDERYKFFIGEINNIPVGIVGFKRLRENNLCYEVNINISPKYRGKGIGKNILKIGINNLKDVDKNLESICANIKSENLASISLFESLGFVLIKIKKNKHFYKLLIDN